MSDSGSLSDDEIRELQDILSSRKKNHDPRTESGEPLRSERYENFLFDEYATRWEISLEWTDAISVRKSNCGKFWEMFYRLSMGEHLDTARRRVYSSYTRSKSSEVKGDELEMFVEDQYLPEELRSSAKELISNEYKSLEEF